MALVDILFPIKKSFDDINQPDDLERIKQNNLELAQRLNREEQFKKENPMKRYHIEVVSGGVALPYQIEAMEYSYGESGCYYFYKRVLNNDGYPIREVLAHFPIDKTIILKIETI